MNVIYSVKDYVSNVFHQDSGSGAIDVVAVQQPDGLLRCSPFHVHFGSLHKLKPEDKQQVTLEVNGLALDNVRMKLGAAGEAYFVHQVQEPVDERDYLASPLPSPISSIGDAQELLAQDEVFAAASAIEPEDEDVAAVKRSASADRLTWGWGALPIVRTGDDSVDDLPTMVKSASVYFDAVDIEATAALAAAGAVDYFDHPSMSLCGHLLHQADTEQDVHRIFSEHIVTFDVFRANPATVLADPNLRFMVDGKLSLYDANMQAYLVSRVLFPYSPHMNVGVAPKGDKEDEELDATAKSFASDVAEVEKGVARCDESVKTPAATISRSNMGRGLTLEPLHEICSDDGGSTQDTSSFTSEPYFKKSLKPSQEELLSMGLRVGTNDISFVLRSHGAGEVARVSANLYLWPVTAKVVIAQIDGAISSSAATGSMFKRRDPAAMHPGALEFYSKLARNGYRVVYVTCHGLSQANMLHTLLHNSTGEDGEIALPMGPVLLSPDRLLATYSNEMIDAQDFKVAALGALRSLFPREVNPFYAAFGTTQTDSIVFTQVGVFSGKVFVVDPADGTVRHRSLLGFHESYSSLMDRMDGMFPPIYSPTTQVPSSAPNNLQLVVPTLHSVPSNLSTTSRVSLVDDEEQLVTSEAVASQVRTRSLADEAYNDINFWRIEPGRV
ncbi:lipin-like protein [Phytophthora cinnamomi]|uniref:lipin-like protein n=1 Tax=Phytophthora cinnamomi TaxID=4785 RepID=UPI0035596637|nr:lipin-like protein [Phytophthora cinnamomi]